jgi:hypothetical protein
VRFELPYDSERPHPFLVGSVIIVAIADLGESELDAVSATMLQHRIGVQPVDGPLVGEQSRWFVGPWSAPDARDEGLVVVSRMQNAILSVAMAGPPDLILQDEVAALATLLWDRYFEQ